MSASFVATSSDPRFVALPGLPDGIFSNQKFPIWVFCSALDWKILVYLIAIWTILRPFGIFYDHLVI
jgi:hypothetical protein